MHICVSNNTLSVPCHRMRARVITFLPVFPWRVTYDTTCKTADMRAVSCRKFLQLWEQFYPNVVVANPMTDICLTCQQNTSKLQRSANLSDREKSECLKAHQDHLNCAQTEREHYKNSCANSEKALETIGTETLLNHESRDARDIKKILMDKWHLIQNQPLLREIYKEPPIISYKRGKSLKDILVRAKL